MSHYLRLLLIAVLACPTTLYATGKADAAERERVRTRMEAVARTLASERGERDALEVQMEDAEMQLSAKQAEVRKLTQGLEAQKQELLLAKTQSEALLNQLADDRKILAAQLRAAYMVGQREQVKLLLSQKTASSVGRVLNYYQYYSRARTQKLSAVVARSRALAQSVSALQSKITEANGLRQTQSAAVQDGLLLKRRRQVLMAQLNERIGDTVDELKRLTASENELNHAIDTVRSSLADLPLRPAALPDAEPTTPATRPVPLGRGHMAWPLRGPVLARYGQAKAGGKLTWKGYWLGAERGTGVRASARGRVAYVGTMHRYGLLVIVEHEEGYFTLYGHLDEVAVKAGDSVNAGQILAGVGDSGGHDQTGLYFEVRRGTDPIDPKDWLAP